jgi:hypothetical protein
MRAQQMSGVPRQHGRVVGRAMLAEQYGTPLPDAGVRGAIAAPRARFMARLLLS